MTLNQMWELKVKDQVKDIATGEQFKITRMEGEFSSKFRGIKFLIKSGKKQLSLTSSEMVDKFETI